MLGIALQDFVRRKAESYRLIGPRGGNAQVLEPSSQGYDWTGRRGSTVSSQASDLARPLEVWLALRVMNSMVSIVLPHFKRRYGRRSSHKSLKTLERETGLEPA